MVRWQEERDNSINCSRKGCRAYSRVSLMSCVLSDLSRESNSSHAKECKFYRPVGIVLSSTKMLLYCILDKLGGFGVWRI